MKMTSRSRDNESKRSKRGDVMASFDPNKYKSIFEQRYGSGSYNAGLSQAREIGRTRVQADIAKQEYNQRLKEAEKARKEAEKAAQKRTYNDALAYWSEPQNNAILRREGAARNAENVRNDPRLKAAVKEQGFNLEDYIDAMYAAVSGGQFRSEREFKQFAKTQQKEANRKPTFEEQLSQYGKRTVAPPQVKKKDIGLLGRIGNFFTSKDVDGDGDRDGLLGAVDRYIAPISKAATDGFIPGNTERMAMNSPNNPVVKAVQKDRGLETDILHGIGTLAAFATPYSKAYKAADLAVNKVPKLANIANPYVKKAITGATAGTMAEAGISATNELANSEAYNMRDYAIRMGIGAAGGAILDPALHGLGRLAQRGLGRLRNVDSPSTPQFDQLGYYQPSRRGQSDAMYERISQMPDRNNRLPLADPPMMRASRNFEPVQPQQDSAIQMLRADLDRYKPIGKSLERLKLPKSHVFDVNVGLLKDIDGFRGYTSDIYRNTRDVFGEHFPKVKEAILDPFDKSKKEYVELQENWLNNLEKDIVKGLGIKKGSKLSKLVQDYGEKTIPLDELKRLEPNDWQKVVAADKWFRKAYDNLIDQVNASRAVVYPNNAEMLVPKRKDYYRHFKELNGLEGIKNIFDTPAGIDPQLVGTSDFTTPRSRWSSMMQKRGAGPYKSDAVGGFLNYLPAASYSIKIDPHIPVFKNLSKQLKDATGTTKNLNHYIEFLEDFSKDLAGKTNFLDRPVQKILGRKTFNGLQWMNNRVKKNAVLGNVGSMLAQIANVPNGVAFAKQHAVPGALKTIKSLISKNDEMAQSGFLKERFSHNMYQQFNTRLIEQPEKFAGWAMTLADRVGTSFVWNSAYSKGVAQGVDDPIKYADDATRRLVAGRGIGEVPLLQKSKTFQFIAPFQLEVANLWKVQKDFVKEKDFAAIVTLYAGAWMLNKGMEETRGSKVVFDPIDAITDALTDEDLSGWEKGGRLIGEVLSNVPLGQTAANFYPEYGTKKLPTREDFFGDRDPNRYGSGLLVAKGVQDPVFKLLPGFGGAQLQKSLKGMDALEAEGAYNKDKSKLKYPVENDPINSIKGTVFGLGGLRETRDFYDNERKPLGTKQTEKYQQFKEQGVGQEYYDQVMVERELANIEKEIKSISEDTKLSEAEKQRRISELMELREELAFTAGLNQ